MLGFASAAGPLAVLSWPHVCPIGYPFCRYIGVTCQRSLTGNHAKHTRPKYFPHLAALDSSRTTRRSSK
jgi:hypothetical protein